MYLQSRSTPLSQLHQETLKSTSIQKFKAEYFFDLEVVLFEEDIYLKKILKTNCLRFSSDAFASFRIGLLSKYEEILPFGNRYETRNLNSPTQTHSNRKQNKNEKNNQVAPGLC